ncbi:MAG: MerR family transcriptional regulator [Planctomycetes bacterium]|nr:MerR family transcriptional regulator [Planctomycetota bacterium]
MKLADLRSRTDLDLEGLAAAAAALLPDLVGRQTRYKVTDVPDLRTLRYYITEGLLDGPLSYDGGCARFGYRHVLQVIAVKKLQSEYLPIRKIREMLSGLEDRALDRIVRDGAPETSKPPGGLGTGLLRSILGRRGTAAPAPASWSRHELAPGLELHVRNDFPIRESNPKTLAQRVEELLRKWKGDTA